MKFYAGIGSRRTPPEVLMKMNQLAKQYMTEGYTLRSGGAVGADRAFERGAGLFKEIFYANDAEPWAFEYVERFCMPEDRSGFKNWKPYIRGLLARNMQQILGRNGDSPVDFVVCWAPSFYYWDSSAGGTGYAIRCALHNNIPVYNLFHDDVVLP